MHAVRQVGQEAFAVICRCRFHGRNLRARLLAAGRFSSDGRKECDYNMQVATSASAMSLLDLRTF
jgi:hypothetical protein